MLTEFVPVGMGQPDALVVGDHDEQHAGALLDLGGQRLQLPVRQLIGECRARRQRGGCRSARRRHGPRGRKAIAARHVQRPGFVLGGEAVVTQEGEHPARDAQRQRHNGDLQHQHLGGEPQIHAQPSHHGKSVRGAPEHNAQNLENWTSLGCEPVVAVTSNRYFLPARMSSGHCSRRYGVPGAVACLCAQAAQQTLFAFCALCSDRGGHRISLQEKGIHPSTVEHNAQ